MFRFCVNAGPNPVLYRTLGALHLALFVGVIGSVLVPAGVWQAAVIIGCGVPMLGIFVVLTRAVLSS